MNHYLVLEKHADNSLTAAPPRDPLYVFACHLAWRNDGNLMAFRELLTALDDPAEEVRILAESLLGRARRCLLATAPDPDHLLMR